MLTTTRGNRLERLADRLAESLRESDVGPFGSEVVLVQNRGMARWLSLAIARRNSVCAGVRFPFPAEFLWEAFGVVLGELPSTSAFDPSVLAWRLMHRFAKLPRAKAFDEVRGYLKEGGDDRRFDLACRVADAYDRYLIYRPDWILAWERGESDHWQARLWRELAETEEPHRVRLERAFVGRLARVASGEESASFELPSRVHVFGIAALPPVTVDLLEALAAHVDVHLLLLDPCREYWGEIVSDRSIARRGEDTEDLHLETGHPLLASMGGLGRDFLDRIADCTAPREEELFEEPSEATTLGILQGDILALRDRGDGDDREPRAVLRSQDDSLRVHACHGPMREVEVLYDRLLDLFRREPDLRPSDVVVMTPDIEAYAPYVEAVFGTVVDADRRIPFSIADRSPRGESPLVDVFLELLRLPDGRFDAASVVSLLESKAVRRRFDIEEDDLESIHRWVQEAGIRWGVDAEDRKDRGLPAVPENTWRAGLDRMMLGYALPCDGYETFEGILPYGEIEGSAGRILGRFRRFARCVFELAGLDIGLGIGGDSEGGEGEGGGRREGEVGGRDAAMPPARWSRVVGEALDRFFEPTGAEEAEARKIREALAELTETTRAAGFDDPIDRRAMLAYLERALVRPDPIAGFLGGGVTFCAMVPMRSIPFEVVALIGMDDARFPRMRKPAGFDLMADDFRRGDRSGRDDDRYLFLEALLSARRKLHISYVGRSIRDNNRIPPSVVVSELLDAVERGFAPEESEGDSSASGAAARITIEHPLQAFSRRYFTGEDPELFSYSEERCQASRRAGRGRGDVEPFLAGPLPAPVGEHGAVSVEDLLAFFEHPVRGFVRSRLGLWLGRGEGLLDVREPFDIDRFVAEDLRERLVELRIEGRDARDVLTGVRASGVLPHGEVGSILFERELERAAAFERRLRSVLRGAGRVGPVDVDLDLGEHRLVGRLVGVTAAGLVRSRAGAMQARDWTGWWIRHLLLCAVAPPDVPLLSRFVHDEGIRSLRPVGDPAGPLADLLSLYDEGLRRPLAYYPRSSVAFARRVARGDEGGGRRDAWNKWNGSRFAGGPGDGAAEKNNAWHALAVRAERPLGEDFEATTLRVLGPLFEHLGDGAGPADAGSDTDTDTDTGGSAKKKARAGKSAARGGGR